ncbi:MAG TPA: hypothetical protein VL424_03135 [Pararobbsia sp.]|jgi:hypothetical protein|nr:hypothetical protein [Pararobbsia sp.]
MPDSHLYRGLEVTLLIYRHGDTADGRGRNADQGFDAAVRIREPQITGAEPRSRVFKLAAQVPFVTVGEAHRASNAYAEHLIDTCPDNRTVFDREA